MSLSGALTKPAGAYGRRGPHNSGHDAVRPQRLKSSPRRRRAATGTRTETRAPTVIPPLRCFLVVPSSFESPRAWPGREMDEPLSRRGAKVVRPLAASGFVLLGGLLLFVDGALIAIAASGPSCFYCGAPTAAWNGSLGAFSGFVLLMLAVYLLLEPQLHRALGIAVVVLSLIVLYIDLGFLFEVLLASIGGILAILFQPNLGTQPTNGAGDQSRVAA
jgi:hypothetical protein